MSSYVELLKRHWEIATLLALFVILGTVYTVVTPIFETPDEGGHYEYVKYLADGRGLPVVYPEFEKNAISPYVINHPPLYYSLAALATCWIDTDDLSTLMWINPHFAGGMPVSNGNKNLIIHTDQEAFPYHGAVLANRLIRLLSVLFSAVTVLATYFIARTLFPDDKMLALGAAAINALDPQFVFISARVGNDSLVTALSSLVMLGLVRHLTDGLSTIGLALLGLAFGAASLSKVSALGLLPIIVLALAIRAARRHSLKVFLQEALIVLSIALVVAGWWFIRNWSLYHDPLAFRPQLQAVGVREPPAKLSELPREFEGLEMSFWALFGSNNILADEAVYKYLFLMVRLAAAGLLIFLIKQVLGYRLRRTAELGLALLAGWFLILFASLLRFMQVRPAAQGRYLFPAISSISLFLALGLTSLVPRRFVRGLISFVAASLFLIAVIAPFRYIAPAYARPPILSPDELPTDLTPLHVDYGGKMELIGGKLGAGSLKPGDTLAVTLCWRSLNQMEEDYSVFVHLFGRDEQPLGQVDTYPGLGSYPTSLWRKGDIICETHNVPISEDAIAPTACRVDVGLYKLETMEGLQAFDGEGRPIGRVSVGKAKLVPRKWPEYAIENPLDFNLGGKVKLIGWAVDRKEARPGGEIKLTLYWECLSEMERDYTVFTHLLNGREEIVAQDDGQPVDGYYPTSLWGRGEVIRDEHTFHLGEDVAEGEYQIEVGMYILESGQRLPIVEGGEIIGDSIPLGRVRVRIDLM